ncbi:MAG: hypothetical protein LAP87_15065 [Acidobacteriia bacterium]|nr:hypothetical protein [Terriglobia bacterium]
MSNSHARFFHASGTLLLAVGIWSCPAAHATAFTLLPQGLMALDYLGWPVGIQSRTLSGDGVEFRFSFTSNQTLSGASMSLNSVEGIGSGALTGLDISGYDSFALQFTLLSVDGVSGADFPGWLNVGAIINETSGVAYQPRYLSFMGSPPATVVSTTPTNESTTTWVGFIASIDVYNPALAAQWPASGAEVRLLVEPAPGAVALGPAAVPEPATALLATMALAIFAGRRLRGRSG